MAWVCAKHHDKLNIAHTKQGKAFLIYGKCVRIDTEYVRSVLADLQGKFKGPRPELSFEAIIHRVGMR